MIISVVEYCLLEASYLPTETPPLPSRKVASQLPPPTALWFLSPRGMLLPDLVIISRLLVLSPTVPTW